MSQSYSKCLHLHDTHSSEWTCVSFYLHQAPLSVNHFIYMHTWNYVPQSDDFSSPLAASCFFACLLQTYLDSGASTREVLQLFFFFYVLQSVYWVLSAAKTCMTYTQCCAWLRHRRRTADAALLLWLRALCRVSILVGHCPISLYSKEHLYVLFYFSHLATQLSQHDFVCLSHTNMNTWPRNPLTPGQIEPSQIWKPYLFLRCMLTVNWMVDHF